MASTEDKIKELLGNGLSNEVVATAVGVHPSRISQLMSDEQFAAEVVTKRTTNLTAATSRDRTWDGIEDQLLVKLGQKIENDMIYKPLDLIRALAVVNGAKRRGVSAQESLVVNKAVVTLNLPTMVIHNYTKNSRGEVVEVTTPEGKQQTLVTMPASALMRQLTSEHQGNKQYEVVRKYLPGSEDAEA